MPYRLHKLWQFNLAGLMLCITVVSVFCGLAVNYPQQAIRCIMLGLPFAPTALLWLVLAGSSRRPVTLIVMSLIGSCVSLLIFPTGAFATAKPVILRVSGDTLLRLDFVELGLLSIGCALGTILFGGVLLLEESRRRPAGANSSSPAAQNPE